MRFEKTILIIILLLVVGMLFSEFSYILPFHYFVSGLLIGGTFISDYLNNMQGKGK